MQSIISLYLPFFADRIRGVGRNLLGGQTRRSGGTEVPGGVQGQNMETLENTNGA